MKKLTLTEKVDKLKHKDIVAIKKQMLKVYDMITKFENKLIEWLI